MESLSIEGTNKTPSVNLDPGTGVIEIKGRSIPENSIEFYRPVVEWLDEYAKDPNKKTTVNVQLEYYNNSSSKCILDIFKKIESLKKARSEVVINWYYEEDDEDMLESGEDYESIIRVPFKMIEIVD